MRLYLANKDIPIEDIEPLPLVPLPEFATGGLIQGGFEVMADLGECYTPTTITCKFSKKSIQRLKRLFQRAIMGSNNWRKRKGMVMYRKVNR